MTGVPMIGKIVKREDCCLTACEEGQFDCGNGQCLETGLCDGVDDCSNARDEDEDQCETEMQNPISEFEPGLRSFLNL